MSPTELYAGRLFLSVRGTCGPRTPAMTTETMFLIVTRYQLRNTYVNGTLLVSTYLCLQKLTPIKGFPKCLSIVSNLQSGPKILCGLLAGQIIYSGPRLQISARVQLWSPIGIVIIYIYIYIYIYLYIYIYIYIFIQY